MVRGDIIIVIIQIFNHEIVKNSDNIKLAIEAMNESEVLKIEVSMI